MNAPVKIKGWCPGALRPMMSGDGLLVRVRIRHATLDPADALAIADLSCRFGNGAIDLTRRANLQIRGVSEAQWPALIDALRARGLIGADEEVGQAVNIVMSPLAGLDSTMAFDVRLLADRIEAGLLADERFRALPSKFGFAIDGGGQRPLGETDADIGIGDVRDEARVAVGLAGSPKRALVPMDDAASMALSLAHAFLALREGDRRVRTLVERVGADAIFLAARSFSLKEGGMSAERHGRFAAGSAFTLDQPGRTSALPLGVSCCGDARMIGVAAPFGAWTADDFSAVARLALSEPGASLRVTPWRVLLIAGLSDAVASRALDQLAACSLIVAPDDPRLAVVACVGAPSCDSAGVATRGLASSLASSFSSSRTVSLHVSGCAKGCAHSHEAPVTLVGRNGRYDLILNGRPDAAPSISGLEYDDAMIQTRKMLSS